MSFGPDFDDLFRVAATYVDRILKGARVVDLPVERSSKFELAVNLRTAKVLVAATSPAWRARGPSSSATDIAGCFDPDYAWHDLAQVWQTPGAGEAAVSQMTQMPAAERAAIGAAREREDRGARKAGCTGGCAGTPSAAPSS